MKIKIVKDDKPTLRERSKAVSFPLSNFIESLGLEMQEYLRKSQDETYLNKHPEVREGVGLAAPQTGNNLRMFAVLFEFDGQKYEYVLINPIITKESAQKAYLEAGEGCLSVNKVHNGYVYRANAISIKGYDLLTKQEVSLDLSGYPAIVFQHEYDHLQGILFYDRINVFDPFFKNPQAIPIIFE